jgi:diguanylate cyclase (GGDEF)-like protein
VTPKGGIDYLSKAMLVNAAVVLVFFQIEVLVHDADTHHAAEHVVSTLILSVPFSLLALAAIWYLNTLRRELAHLAATDLLTGLKNRRAFLAAAQTATAQKRGVLMMIDLDHFKKINDTYGHAVGDECLRAMADVLREQVRENDILGRLGGEEFAILLVDAPIEAAVQIGERICAGVDLSLENVDSVVKITASVGVVEKPETDDFESVLTLADMAMYQAKADGRARVVFWEKGVTARVCAEPA